jgi:4-hydroxy-3-methylbut-2-enyl diphosphate reductase
MKKRSIKTIKNAGFCFGVERAYNLAKKELKNNKHIVYSLGDLIHNKQVVEELNTLGTKPIKDLSEIPTVQGLVPSHDSVIIRAHGISKEINEEIKNKDLKIIDATCPYVKVPQNAVKEYGKKGYFIFIAGDEGHPEVEGIKSYVNEDKRIIANNVKTLKEKLNTQINNLNYPKKATLVSQTTLSFETLSEIALFLMKYIEELVVINSICDATNVRQQETRELAQKSDIMIIIGGRHSANTKRLQEISAEYTTSIQIETEYDLKKEWFKNKENIGITAGASTPNWIIERVENKIKDYTS